MDRLPGKNNCPWCGVKSASIVRHKVEITIPMRGLVQLVEKMQAEGAAPDDDIVIHLGDEEKEAKSDG